jgi:hypothetical protein
MMCPALFVFCSITCHRQPAQQPHLEQEVVGLGAVRPPRQVRKRLAARKALVEDAAQGVDVRGLVDPLGGVRFGVMWVNQIAPKPTKLPIYQTATCNRQHSR